MTPDTSLGQHSVPSLPDGLCVPIGQDWPEKGDSVDQHHPQRRHRRGKSQGEVLHALTNVTMLKAVWISQTSATQRKGRAGLCQHGKVRDKYTFD